MGVRADGLIEPTNKGHRSIDGRAFDMPILRVNLVDYGYGTNIFRARKLGVALRQAGGGLSAAAYTKSQKCLARKPES